MEALTKIKICSQVSLMLGGVEIKEFDNLSAESVLLANFFDTLYKSELSNHTWNFAMRRQPLTLLPPLLAGDAFGENSAEQAPVANFPVNPPANFPVNPPANSPSGSPTESAANSRTGGSTNQQADKVSRFDEYKYYYQLPADMLRLNRILVQNRHVTLDYTIAANILYCNQPDLWIEYISADTKIDAWPAYFLYYFQLKLAALLALSLTQQPFKMQIYEKMAKEQLLDALYIDSQNQPAGQLDLSYILNVR